MPDISRRLVLPCDGPVRAPTLSAHLTGWAGNDSVRQSLALLIQNIANAVVPLAERLALGRLPGDPAAVTGTNRSGDRQKALDTGAHAHFLRTLADLSVAQVLSEEADEITRLDPGGQFDIAIDPIDGSGSIGIGAPLGMLFCVFPAGSGFDRDGREILAAGYASFGHTVDFGFSLGNGVVLATLDPHERVFRIETTNVTVPEDCNTIAFNASNMRRWQPGLRRYVDSLIAGSDGPRGRDFNMRWIAAAVADLNRILRRGGLFLYPADGRRGHEQGFLRLAYEAFPIAYLMEQAQGAASDGTTPILDLTPDHPHARVPMFFGSRRELAVLHDHLATSQP